MKHGIDHVLLVEDNPGDVFLLREAWQEAALPGCIEVAVNGEEALDYLYRRGRFENARRPDLVILDLNLPLRSGREVLADMRQDPAISGIPVAVLTTSSSDWDICAAYNIAPCLYFIKPPQFPDLVAIVGRMCQLATRKPDASSQREQ